MLSNRDYSIYSATFTASATQGAVEAAVFRSPTGHYNSLEQEAQSGQDRSRLFSYWRTGRGQYNFRPFFAYRNDRTT